MEALKTPLIIDQQTTDGYNRFAKFFDGVQFHSGEGIQSARLSVGEDKLVVDVPSTLSVADTIRLIQDIESDTQVDTDASAHLAGYADNLHRISLILAQRNPSSPQTQEFIQSLYHISKFMRDPSDSHIVSYEDISLEASGTQIDETTENETFLWALGKNCGGVDKDNQPIQTLYDQIYETYEQRQKIAVGSAWDGIEPVRKTQMFDAYLISHKTAHIDFALSGNRPIHSLRHALISTARKGLEISIITRGERMLKDELTVPSKPVRMGQGKYGTYTQTLGQWRDDFHRWAPDYKERATHLANIIHTAVQEFNAKYSYLPQGERDRHIISTIWYLTRGFGYHLEADSVSEAIDLQMMQCVLKTFNAGNYMKDYLSPGWNVLGVSQRGHARLQLDHPDHGIFYVDPTVDKTCSESQAIVKIENAYLKRAIMAYRTTGETQIGYDPSLDKSRRYYSFGNLERMIAANVWMLATAGTPRYSEQRIAYIQNAINANPIYADAWMELARNTKDTAKARQALSHALRLNPYLREKS